MTHSVNTSIVSSSRTNRYFTVEIVDYDNESYEYNVEARNSREANDKAQELAYADGIDINYMNIYTF